MVKVSLALTQYTGRDNFELRQVEGLETALAGKVTDGGVYSTTSAYSQGTLVRNSIGDFFIAVADTTAGTLLSSASFVQIGSSGDSGGNDGLTESQVRALIATSLSSYSTTAETNTRITERLDDAVLSNLLPLEVTAPTTPVSLDQSTGSAGATIIQNALMSPSNIESFSGVEDLHFSLTIDFTEIRAEGLFQPEIDGITLLNSSSATLGSIRDISITPSGSVVLIIPVSQAGNLQNSSSLSVIFTYSYLGPSWIGSFNIEAASFYAIGALHNDIQTLVNQGVDAHESSVNRELDTLRSQIRNQSNGALTADNRIKLDLLELIGVTTRVGAAPNIRYSNTDSGYVTATSFSPSGNTLFIEVPSASDHSSYILEQGNLRLSFSNSYIVRSNSTSFFYQFTGLSANVRAQVYTYETRRVLGLTQMLDLLKERVSAVEGRFTSAVIAFLGSLTEKHTALSGEVRTNLLASRTFTHDNLQAAASGTVQSNAFTNGRGKIVGLRKALTPATSILIQMALGNTLSPLVRFNGDQATVEVATFTPAQILPQRMEKAYLQLAGRISNTYRYYLAGADGLGENIEEFFLVPPAISSQNFTISIREVDTSDRTNGYNITLHVSSSGATDTAQTQALNGRPITWAALFDQTTGRIRVSNVFGGSRSLVVTDALVEVTYLRTVPAVNTPATTTWSPVPFDITHLYLVAEVAEIEGQVGVTIGGVAHQTGYPTTVGLSNGGSLRLEATPYREVVSYSGEALTNEESSTLRAQAQLEAYGLGLFTINNIDELTIESGLGFSYKGAEAGGGGAEFLPEEGFRTYNNSSFATLSTTTRRLSIPNSVLEGNFVIRFEFRLATGAARRETYAGFFLPAWPQATTKRMYPVNSGAVVTATRNASGITVDANIAITVDFISVSKV